VQLRIFITSGVTLGPRAQSRKSTDSKNKKRTVPYTPATSPDTIASNDQVKSAESESPAILKSPLAQDEIIDSLDSRYFHFFLLCMPHIIPHAIFFPKIISDIFARSVPHRPLRHSVLGISSMVSDYRLSRPMDRFYIQYKTSRDMIQNALQTINLDEGIAISVFLLLWIDVVRAELHSARKLLRGLYQILDTLQRKYSPPEATEAGILVDDSGGVGVSPLIMQIWRIAIRLDFTTSLYLVEPPMFPPIPVGQEHLHRKWITSSTSGDEETDWALAAFAQDDLIHRACHFAFQARAIRRASGYSPKHEREILTAVEELEEQNRSWKNRSVVLMAENYEQTAQYIQSVDSSVFHDYPPLNIINPLYANLLNSSRATGIYISLIAYPVIGPGPNPQRFLDAVEICRTFAALGEDKSHAAASKIWIMFLAGVAFGGLRRSPGEAKWILWKVEDVLKMFPLMKDAVRAYKTLWDADGDFWDEMDNVQVIRK
jgi:hypothetical protein